MRPTPVQLTVAGIGLFVVLAFACCGSVSTSHHHIFSLSPPPPAGAPEGTVMPPDTPVAKREVLHRTVMTAWAALVMTTAAFCTFLFRRTSAWWLVFWTAGFLAFFVHFHWAVFRFFDGDWSRVTSSTRVSAPILGTLFMLWWGVDVVLAWLVTREGKLIAIQRWLVHVLAFVLFFAGSVLQGEVAMSRILGWGMVAAVAVSVLVAMAWRTARPLPDAAGGALPDHPLVLRVRDGRR